jgi:hypothetical protein
MATSMIRLPRWPTALAGRRTVRARSAADHRDVPLARGERVLATARQTDGSPVLATKLALYRMPPADSGPGIRLGWEQIRRADWIERQGLVLHGWTPDVPARTVLAVSFGEPLLAFARERIAWTTLLATRVPVGAHGGAQVTARRQPGSGRLLWMVTLDPGVRDDATTRDGLAAALARLRADLALGPW